MLKNIFGFLGKRKWENIFSTQDMQKHFSVKGKLMDNKIPFKTEIIDPNRRRGNHYVPRQSSPITYNILVNVEDIHIANEIIFRDKN